MTAKDPKKGMGELEILFPHAEVKCPDGSTIKVTPLMLEDLPKVLDSFTSIINMVESGTPPAAIALAGLKELLEIMPYCVDRPKSEVPSAVVPHVLGYMLKQNLATDTLGKWQALIQLLSDMAGPDNAPASQSKKPSGS